jgi:3'DNA-binding domain (3'BD)
MWCGEIVLGWVVHIPYGKNEDDGIIVGFISPDTLPSTVEIRDILSVVSSTPLLAPYQIDMIFALGQRYFIPLHKVLRMFLPSPLMSRLDKKNYILSSSEDGEKSEKKHEIIHYSTTPLMPLHFWEYEKDGSLFLFPDDFFLLTGTKNFSDTMTVLLSESTSTRKSRLWIDMYEWKARRIVWTRRLLYYNLRAFSHLYYIEDAFGDEDYQYPTRIRNLDILRMLADTSDISLSILTSSPTLELFAKFRDFRLQHI